MIIGLDGFNNKSPYELTRNELQNLAGLGEYYPGELPGNKNPEEWVYVDGLGWFGSKIFKKVKRAVKSAVSVATSAVKNVARTIRSTMNKIPGMNIALTVGKNINPYIAMADTALKIAENPSSLTDPKKLGSIVVNKMVPEKYRSIAKIGFEIVKDPGKLKDPKAMAGMALNKFVPEKYKKSFKMAQSLYSFAKNPSTSNFISQVQSNVNIKLPIKGKLADQFNQVKSLIKQGKASVEQIQDFKNNLAEASVKLAQNSTVNALKAVGKEDKIIMGRAKGVMNGYLKTDKVNRCFISILGRKANSIEIRKYKNHSESALLGFLMKNPRYGKLDKLTKINRAYKGLLNREADITGIKVYSQRPYPEESMFIDLYKSEEFQKKQAVKSKKMLAKSKEIAKQRLKAQRNKARWDKTRFIQFKNPLEVNIKTIPEVKTRSLNPAQPMQAGSPQTIVKNVDAINPELFKALKTTIEKM